MVGEMQGYYLSCLILIGNLKSLQSHRNFALHPLMHTLLEFDLTQCVVFC